MTVLPSTFPAHRLGWCFAMLAAIAAGLFIAVAGDMGMQARVVAVLAVAGVVTLAIIPNRRIVLVCAWILAHPLSLEKVFPLFNPTHAGFLATPLVVSGSDLVFYVLLITVFFESAFSKERTLYWSWSATSYTLYSLWICAMFLFCGPTGDGLMQVFMAIKTTLFLVVMSSVIRTSQELKLVLVTMAVAVLIQSGILSASYVMKKTIGFSSKIADTSLMEFSGGGADSIHRATGTVGHVNQQAMFHTFFTIPLAALFMVKNWIWKGLSLAVVIASCVALILTFSRASWISCGLAAATILFLAWKHNRMTHTAWLCVWFGGIFFICLVGIFSPMIAKRLTKGDDGASMSRVHIALLALEHIERRPITGVGPGNFINSKVAEHPIRWARSVWLPRGFVFRPQFIDDMEVSQVELQEKWYYTSVPTHNRYLLVGAELGIIGLGLFIWFQAGIWAATVRLLKTKDSFLWWVAVTMVAGFFACQTEFMFELFYNDKTVLIPLFINAVVLNLDRLIASETQGGLSVCS